MIPFLSQPSLLLFSFLLCFLMCLLSFLCYFSIQECDSFLLLYLLSFGFNFHPSCYPFSSFRYLPNLFLFRILSAFSILFSLFLILPIISIPLFFRPPLPVQSLPLAFSLSFPRFLFSIPIRFTASPSFIFTFSLFRSSKTQKEEESCGFV